MTHFKTILLCLFGAIAFGIVHDLVTANICVEYFTIAHPKIIGSEDPVYLALVWGVLATWWVGLILGLLMVFFNRLGKHKEVPFSIIRRNVIRLLLIMMITSLAAGLIGFILAKAGVIYLVGEFAESISPHKHNAFLAVGWAHVSSYIIGFIGGIVTCVKIWMRRTRKI
ncbi:hypothetical protein [Fluviicola chungangensis]|uniref:Uncharacterized protein n=1 Tax=Fluviicola chungangensis TaxID=2597671 RepID=A0A556MQF1_9FLAO|nr:hypothetical protein [Fluviicola chungangensis]TSJ41979.1 hypothetical protein FO442_12880 [Fluviicola chungangensis]